MSENIIQQQPDHAARSHHKFGMSRLPYIEDCPGFQNAESSEAAQKAADEGEALHEIMDKVAQRVKELAPAHAHKFSDVLPFVLADEKKLIEENERLLLEFCCREIDKFLKHAPKLIENEIKVHIFRPDGSELNHGHLDLLLVCGGDYAVLLDYKFGWKMVPAAKDNLQGLGYGLGVFNRHQKINRLGVVFIQPKLNRVTTRLLHRNEYAQVYQRIEQAIERAISASELPPGSDEFAAVVRPGPYCAYCSLKGRCAGQMKQATLAVTEFSRQPLSVDWSRLDSPEQMAKARYLVDVLENLIGEVKSRAMEVAEANGGTLETVLPDGQTVSYEVASRSVSRSVGEAGLVSELLAEHYDIAPMEVMAAADLSLGKLTPLGVKVIQDRVNGSADKELAETEAFWQAEVTAGKITAKDAKEKVKAAKRTIKEQKITKKEAEDQFHTLLESEGLLSRPDTTIRYLRLKKQNKEEPKQVTE